MEDYSLDKFIKTSIATIKEGRFFSAVVGNVCRLILNNNKEFVVTARPRHLPEGKKILTDNTDYIRFATLELLCQELIQRNIQGNLAELGVYRGDFSRMMNHYFPNRVLYLFDTFEGFDERDKTVDINSHFSSVSTDFSQTSVDFVLSRMEYPERCVIKKGYFPETGADVDDTFALVSLDVDLYAPIRAGLEFFVPRLVPGGIMMIHDFTNKRWSGVSKAVREYADSNSLGYVCLPDLSGSVVIVK